MYAREVVAWHAIGMVAFSLYVRAVGANISGCGRILMVVRVSMVGANI